MINSAKGLSPGGPSSAVQLRKIRMSLNSPGLSNTLQGSCERTDRAQTAWFDQGGVGIAFPSVPIIHTFVRGA